jgi:hypothetical protein
MSKDQNVVQEVRDILKSYYKVSRKTFVDCVYRQSVMYNLLQCDESPLRLLPPIFVNQLSVEALEEVAGEEPSMERARAQLNKKVAGLAKAAKILARL